MARERLIARRNELGLTQEDLAHLANLDRRSVNRYERGSSTPRGAARRRLAKALQWNLTELDASLGNGVEPRVGRRWFSLFVTLEQSASALRTWEPMLVPGLFQTKAYAAALLNDDVAVEQRLMRQATVARNDDPVELTAVLDQSVLYRPVGGTDVLADQLDHLVAMSERQNVTLHVFTGPVPLFATSSVVILGFEDDDVLVYLQHRTGAVYLDGTDDIDTYTALYRELTDELALPPPDSRDLIRARAKDLRT